MTTTPKYILEIVPDACPESPREWSNLCTLATAHRRYTLGEKEFDGDLVDLIYELEPDIDDEVYDMATADPEMTVEDCERHALDRFDELYFYRTVYLYDHSGLSVSLGGFACPWDSAPVGIIFVRQDEAQQEYCMTKRELTIEEYVDKVMESEIKVFDQYIRGDVYGFILRNGDGEEVDSCWGFYGYDIKENGILDHVNTDEISEVRWMQPDTVTGMVPWKTQAMEEVMA